MLRKNEIFAKIPFDIPTSSTKLWVHTVYLVMSRISNIWHIQKIHDKKISEESKVQRKGRILTHFYVSTLTGFVYNFDMFIEFEIVWQAIEYSTSCSMILHFIQQMNVIPTANTQNNNFHLCSSLTPFLILHSVFCCFFYLYWNVLYFVNWKWSMSIHLACQMSNVNKSFPTQHLIHSKRKSQFKWKCFLL